MKIVILSCFIFLFSNVYATNRTFEVSSDSIKIVSNFIGEDSLYVTVKNLSKDSIYFPTKNISLLYEVDSIVEECRIQVGLVSPGDCKTTSVVTRLFSNQERTIGFKVPNINSFRKVKLSVDLQFITAFQFIEQVEGMEFNESFMVGDCLLDNMSESVSLYTFFYP